MSNATRALIIDDDAMNLEVIGRLLAIEGIACTKAQNLQQIQAVLAINLQPDLVFLDLEMPQMDGYQVLKLLRSKLGSEIPIIACTVHLNEAMTARELGFDGFISKPLDQKRFSNQVNHALKGEQVWDL